MIYTHHMLSTTMLRLIANAVQQYIDDSSVDDLKVVLDEINDHTQWQQFILDTVTRVEHTLFRKEFGRDCGTMATATLVDLKHNSESFGIMATEELEAREHRRLVRKTVLASLHDGHHHDLCDDPLFVMYNDRINKYKGVCDEKFDERWAPVDFEHSNVSDEERADIIHTDHTIYMWAINNLFFDTFNNMTVWSKIFVCSNQVPKMIEYMMKNNESVVITKIFDTVTSFYQNMPTNIDTAITWSINMARSMVEMARDYATFPLSHQQVLSVIKRHLVALQDCMVYRPYALDMLYTLQLKFDREYDDIDDLVQHITYDYMSSHNDPYNLLTVFSHGWIRENGRDRVMEYITHQDLKDFIDEKCRK